MEISKIIRESISLKEQLLADRCLIDRMVHLIAVMTASLKSGGKIHFCGNGGSAADAQHLAAELSGRFYYDRPPLNAEALHCNTSFLTAVGNDYGYEHIFARLLQGTGKKGDVLVGLSTSGNSENIVRAFEMARQMEIYTCALTGTTGGKMADADMLLNVPSSDTPRIQEVHILLGHIICQGVEETMFPKNE
ncbi:MAG: D-sedoheptulose 7-phosphate isomerase [Bacteroidales bacterium]|jgi:D-sedoheptulose 7-phosphate isomerase|nr:D-sedoheptulose 7-phosphate isomerase [Bacteroidales bacterium]